MSVATIRTAVVTLLESISGAGKVNDLDLFNCNPEDFEDAFVDQARAEVRGWAIGIREGQGRQSLGMLERVYEVRLMGLFGRREAARSRATVDTLLESVITTFFGTAANRRLLNSGTPSVDFTDPGQTTVEDYMIRTSAGEVPGHRVIVTFTAVKESALA